MAEAWEKHLTERTGEIIAVALMYWNEDDMTGQRHINKKVTETDMDSLVESVKLIQNEPKFTSWPSYIIPEYEVLLKKLESLGL